MHSMALLQFAVILRQASFFAPVMYGKSTLPSQKIRLPCLTATEAVPKSGTSGKAGGL